MEACSASAESGDGRTVFAMTPNGQLKMPRVGNYCLTMAGDGAVDANIAPGAALAATSSSAEHAVKNAADGDAQSYWASGFDPKGPVDVQLDFGAAKRIKSIEIEWEYPAQARVFTFHFSFAWFVLELRRSRHTSCRWQAEASGQVYSARPATICKQPSLPGLLFWALPSGSV